MRVFVTTTPHELTPYQRLVNNAVSKLGFEVLQRDPQRGRGLTPVEACARQVARADLVLALVGHRRGPVPTPAQGGDGRHPWAWWETRAAFDNARPVMAFLATDDWRPDLQENQANARAVMQDFRGELARLATFFEDEQRFRQRLQERVGAAPTAETLSEPSTITLRQWPPPTLPPHPYPVLLPYTHPDLLAGRDAELDEIRRVLARPVAITGLHAPSGTGKSSFLHAGVVNGLRAEGRPVAFDRRPNEPGLVQRLLGDLVEDVPIVHDNDPDVFVDLLHDVLRNVGKPPLLVLDQFEDLFRYENGEARDLVAELLAASVQRLPGLYEPPCRWLLAYRQEFHGQVFRWLGNLGVDGLPNDLSTPERFQTWTLSPLGTPPPGTRDRLGAATRIFRGAIEKPLHHYSAWQCADNGTERLANAFAEARQRQRKAPLAPELQVVLAHLLAQAVDGRINVPDDPAALIDHALEEHLRRSLDTAFPVGRQKDTTLRRTRALLALRELADVQGRRDEGRPASVLARAIGEDGRDVFEKLSTAQTRVVLLEQHEGDHVYVLSHDRIAEAIVRLVDDEGAYTGLGVDTRLLRLRRFVTLQRELFLADEIEQSTNVPKAYFNGIASNTEALLWDDTASRWWEACRERRQRDRRQTLIRGSVAVAFVFVLTAVVWTLTQQYFERQALLETVAEGEPEAAFKALADLTAVNTDAEEILAQVRQRKEPFDVLERGLEGVGDEERGDALIRVTELLLPLQQAEAPESSEWIASMVWALDFFAGEEQWEHAVALRNEILKPIRTSRPPPPLPTPNDTGWADIPAGTFMMGSGPGEGRDAPNMANEWPKHPVQLSPFRMMIHEVTNSQFGRLFPDWSQKEARLPAASMTWHQAYTYAAWLGGRLPTEAESEYVLRGGCEFAYCKRDGTEATLDEVAWWVGNSAAPETEEPVVHEVMLLEPSPWGLYDIHGNVLEFSANWYSWEYQEGLEINPQGPGNHPDRYRAARGGSSLHQREWVTAPARVFLISDWGENLGLRVVLQEIPKVQRSG